MKEFLLFPRSILFIILFNVSLPGVAQENEPEPRLLTLDEAVLLAEQQSRQLALDSLGINIGVSTARQQKQLSLPDVSINGSYVRISDNITPFKVAFPTGEVILNPQILNQSYNSFQARQLLWAGGRLNTAQRISQLETELLIHGLSKSKTDVRFGVLSLWYQLFALQQSKKTILSNIRLLSEQRKDAQHSVDQGLLLQNELLKIDLAVTSMESSLVEIVSLQKTISFNVSVLTGLDVNTPLMVPDQLPLLAKQISSSKEAMELAISKRQELKQFEIRYKQADLGLKISRSSYYPILFAGGQYNYDLPNQRLFPNQPVFTGTWNIGLFMTWSLTGLLTSKEKVHEATLNISQVAVARSQALDGIRMEVNGNFNAYSRAAQKILIAEKALEQATENFRVDQNRFKASTVSATDFLNANTLLLQAELNLLAARASADLAYHKLLASTNN